MKHTPGPWRVTGNKKLYIEPLNMQIHWQYLAEDCKNCNTRKTYDINEGSQLYSARGLKEAQANAQRIVDCVNACEGINPKAVKQLLKMLRNVCQTVECEPIDSPNILAAVQEAYNTIDFL